MGRSSGDAWGAGLKERIRANAALVIGQFSPLADFDFGFNARSVAWVDGFIENQRQRPDRDHHTEESLIDILGSFLGECIISCFGGQWEQREDQWCIHFGSRNALYPFHKVRKRFANGPQDSIETFFSLIPLTFPEYVQLEWHIRQAEAAYARLYEARSDSERAAAYSDCKEGMADALHLARKLGLEERAVKLERKLAHYKAVFRHQMDL